MPTTTNKAIPYPVSTDTPDVPRDILAMANRLDALLGGAEATSTTDLNALTGHGRYLLDAVTNGPTASTGWYVDVVRGSATYIRQTATPAYVTSGASWVRTMIAGVWGSWRLATPHARTSGQAVTPAGGSVAVTFPASLFSAAPKVAGSLQVAAMPSSVVSWYVGSITASGFTLRVNSSAALAGGAGTVDYVATQDTP